MQSFPWCKSPHKGTQLKDALVLSRTSWKISFGSLDLTLQFGVEESELMQWAELQLCLYLCVCDIDWDVYVCLQKQL